MKRCVPGSVVVVVGATSGVGLATALSLAAQHVRLVVVSRGRARVDEVVERCRSAGAADVIGIAADIGVAADVDRIRDGAVQHFGHIDTWINCAAGLLIGELPSQPVEEIERLIATNVLGLTLVSRAAMTQFEAQGTGVLVNVSSLLGLVPNPLVPTYSMSKFAVRGLTLCLHEAARKHPDIAVCAVLPGPIDTPMFEHAANHAGAVARAIPPASSPERVAATIMRSVRRPRRQRTVGATGALIMIGHHVVPRFTEAAVARIAARLLLTQVAAPAGAGALWHDESEPTIGGGWRRSRPRELLGDAIGRRLARRT